MTYNVFGAKLNLALSLTQTGGTSVQMCAPVRQSLILVFFSVGEKQFGVLSG